VIGEIVDGYEILRPLGTGGMGEVYLGRNAEGSLRALKLVRTDQQTSPTAAGRFRREVLALGKLQHPNIIQIHDVGRLPTGAMYLGMEYVAGPDLQQAVGWEGPFGVADTLEILRGIAAALVYAHRAGVVHRDLKPANVILEGGDAATPKIIDFGLAKIVEDEGLTRLTEDKQAIGSPLYWAPEQSKNSDVGPPADIYSVGGIAYFLLSGQPLFKPAPAVALVYAHANEMPQPLAIRCKHVALPPGLSELVAACVAKSPQMRPTASDLVPRLDAMIAAMPEHVSHRTAGSHRLFTSTGMTSMGEALTNQIRQVLLDLAGVLERPIDDIDRLQQELSDQEIELAMIESDPGADASALRERVDKLRSAVADAFRELFVTVNQDRNRPVAEAHSLFGELDALVEQFRTL
jgi:serine/threonine protein kinase